MLKKISKKYILLAVIMANTFFGIVFLWGCAHTDNEISLEEKSTNNREIQEKSIPDQESGTIYVYVSGAVKKPGVYAVKEGSRVYQVIELAGGMTKSAKKDYLNQAETVVDSQNILVLTQKQYNKMQKSDDEIIINNNKTDDEKININSADISALMQLSGIGETKAKAIIAYREENGNFAQIEDIKNVSGIGDSTFANISADITVD